MILTDKVGNELCQKCSGNYEAFCACRDKKEGFGKKDCYHEVNNLWGHGLYDALPENDKYPFFPFVCGIDYEWKGYHIVPKRKSMEEHL